MDKTRTCESCEYVALSSYSGKCLDCTWDNNKQNWKENTMKPTVKEIEEYMAALNIPMEQGLTQGLNGISAYDIVSKPKHYMLFDEATVVFFADNEKGIEVRDVIEQLVLKVQGQDLKTVPHWTKEAALFEADYVQLMQYLMRFMDKNGKEDLEKARWYLDKMISAY